MRITDIHIDGFGVWNDLSVDNLSPGVTLFFGRNEAGKTTLMQFVRAVLYGFSAERRKLYLPPVHGGVPGGMLRVENHNGPFVVERRVSERNENSPGRIVVLAANGSRQGQQLLNVLLNGVDESIFHNVFAIGIRELQELATLNDTQAAELLYNLASGVDRVSLVEVMRDLAAAREAILHPLDQPGEVSRLLEQQTVLLEETAELESQTRRWSDLATERGRLAAEVVQLEEKIENLKYESRTVEIAIQVRDTWFSRLTVEKELQACGKLEKLPERCTERLDELNAAIREQDDHLQPLRKRRIEIRREMAAQPVNRAIWDGGPRIEAVCEHGPWIHSLDNELHRLRADIEAGEIELLRHEEKLAAEGGAVLASAPVVSARSVQQLQPAALTLREALKKRALARKQQKQTRRQEEQTANTLQEELAGHNTDNLEEALQKASELVSNLRRRVRIEDRLEQMHKQQDELEQEHQNLLDLQLQRVRILIGIGAMFVFGFVLALTGIFGWRIMPLTAEVSWGISFLGLVCLVLSCAWKVLLERTTQEEISTCSRQQESLDREIEQTLEERDELDRVLPMGSGAFSSRLATAERELKELEAMVPLHQERLEANRRRKESRRETSGTDDELREARIRWRRGLRSAGLPETLTPKQVRQLAAHHQKKSKIQELVNRHRERLTKLQADRNALVSRLQQLHLDIGIHSLSDDPQVQLSQLAAALAGQREMVQRRKELLRDEKEVRKQITSGLVELRRLKRGREALFAESRVTDEDELRNRVAQIKRAADLTNRRQALSDQIRTIVGGHCPEEEIGRELQQHAAPALQQRWQQLVSRLQSSQTHLGQLQLRRGEINQEMKTLAENRRPAQARFQLGCVRQKLADATRRWRVLTAAWLTLETIRQTYEAERQPETLDEASIYLERLTEGKYSRIWTPLGRNELRVDDQNGKPIALELLSRGTREAVFLSLRLALVTSYGRRGVAIPIVLDDVLVNLDSRRAESAVRLLCSFAQDGRQLLFFTCHDHIRQMFDQAGVDVRVVPAYGTPGARIARQQTADPAPVVPEPPPTVMETLETEADAALDVEPDEVEPAVPLAVAQEQHDDEELVFAVSPSEEIPPSSPAAPVPHEPLLVAEDDEEYYLAEPAEKSRPRPKLDIALFTENELQADEEDEAVVAPPAVEDVEEHDPLDEPFDDYVEDINRVFGEFDDEDNDYDGPWWDADAQRWLQEEETAA